MTEPKREPFAVGTFGDGFYYDTGKYYEGRNILLGGSYYLAYGIPHDVAEEKIRGINLAFNARVDEEIKKAVEKFRERAAKLMEDPDACPEDIRRLPTEPERGKE